MRKVDYVKDPLVAQMNLPAKQCLVWSVLWTFQGQNEYAWPSLGAIQERLCGRLSKNAISKHIQALKKKGWLQVVRRGKGRSNLYAVLIPEDLLFVPNFGKISKVPEAKQPIVSYVRPNQPVLVASQFEVDNDPDIDPRIF